MSHTSTEALRTTMVDDQTGSKLERSACGTKRSVRAPARWEIAGVASPPVASAPAPAIALSIARRCTMLAPSGRTPNDDMQELPGLTYPESNAANEGTSNMAMESAMESTAARPGLPGVIVAATIGNVLEWFDFLVYGFFAVYMSE